MAFFRSFYVMDEISSHNLYMNMNKDDGEQQLLFLLRPSLDTESVC